MTPYTVALAFVVAAFWLGRWRGYVEAQERYRWIMVKAWVLAFEMSGRPFPSQQELDAFAAMVARREGRVP